MPNKMERFLNDNPQARELFDFFNAQVQLIREEIQELGEPFGQDLEYESLGPIEPIYDKNWLLKESESHIQQHGHVLDEYQLSSDLFTILRSSKPDIQNDLVDLIGYDNLDFVMQLVEHREELVDTITKEAPPAYEPNAEKEIQVTRPKYGAQVTVLTLSEKEKLKQFKKKSKKLNQGEHDAEESSRMLGFDGARLREAREAELYNNALQAATRPLKTAQKQEVYPNVYQSGQPTSLSIFGTKFVLPAGTVREESQNYEKISIPVSKPAAIRTNEKAVTIDQFEPWIQPVYKGYKSLNRVQSIVYPIAFETNENMLVCAPTGAGKTDVAMLTVLRCISQNRFNSIIQLDDFKIVYVAPMKALAAEIVRKFSSRLGHLGVKVRELTGDMQLTKTEINETQMIVTTPEKWDVVTRKSVGDTQLVDKVKLLIIDEVHLLHEDRGSVIESIVARTLRMVESSQSMIRIVGLSATLPNYVDVAQFLGVNLYQGLFYFDSGFRPVPLEQHFIGIKAKPTSIVYRTKLNTECYERVRVLVQQGHQVMVFVHSRKDTVKTAQSLLEEAKNEGLEQLFSPQNHEQYGTSLLEVQKSRNKELKELFIAGLGIHHAGMLRTDRTLTEKMFAKGLLKVLCCTATLAWGVNLPAYAVVIKGTTLYNAEKGSFVDLSILDVLQIFGRAGRPQFEDRGVGYILTSHDKLNHYVSAITQQHPIESSFAQNLVNNLNAEVSLGTITNMTEAVRWLSYTYLYVRMKKNPFNYGMDWSEPVDDPSLIRKRTELLTIAARKLHQAQMIVFDETTGYLIPKDLGRIASNYYIDYNTVEIINTMMRPHMTEADVLAMLSMSKEFENIAVRPEEVIEMKKLHDNECVCDVKGGIDTNYGKANVLLQSYISGAFVQDFALISDAGYVAQNSSRLLRAFFEISLSRNWGPAAAVILSLCKTVDKRMWSFQHPLLQFPLPQDIKDKLDKLPSDMNVETLKDMDAKEIGALIRNNRMGELVYKFAYQLPMVEMNAVISPITRTILRVELKVKPTFRWHDSVHGSIEPFYIWVEDSENTEILYSEYILISKKQHKDVQTLAFTIPIPYASSTTDNLPSQIFIRAVSDRWIGSETVLPVSFKHLILPEHNRAPHTNLLNLQPLPISALKDPVLEEICRQRFEYFNPVQTQIFHTLYHTKENVLLGAPTGSGKTIAAELAMWSAFRDFPKSKVVYIAPLKALVKERVQDWRKRLMPLMGRNLVELTGDVTPDLKTIENADVIITTPEKWDGVSRSWKSRKYVTDTSCVIIDEIHLLGGDRGPILEVIVSRMNYISTNTDKKIRIVGLSTALANASDLADWLGIKYIGLFNFRHSVRPVPLEIYIEGYPGKHYCPRMISMNKPAYSAIMTHSPTQPVIVFVSSRRQTRLTAKDIISLCANDDNPRRFLHMPEQDMESIVSTIQDASLKLCLQFGIGLHHAGLVEKDRQVVEELFLNGKIQVLIATSTLAWGVNLPAHLVVVKGTEYFDAKTKKYKDYPITDILQMMGRAGRPQFDNAGVAVVLVHDVKKNFYKKFLHEPFPVESSLHECLHEHLNAEIATGTIRTKQDAMDYMTWTYLFRRVAMNPTYYGCHDSSEDSVNYYLSRLIEDTLLKLQASDCIQIGEDDSLSPTAYGYLTSHYYLKYETIKIFNNRLAREYRSHGNPEENEYIHGDFSKLLRIMSDALEYAELSIRHNEDIVNSELEMQLPVPVFEKKKNEFDDPNSNYSYGSTHVKTFLLLQAYLSRLEQLPIADYVTDTLSVLDQAIRLVQSMISS